MQDWGFSWRLAPTSVGLDEWQEDNFIEYIMEKIDSFYYNKRMEERQTEHHDFQ